MAERSLPTLLRCLRRLADAPGSGTLTDGQLLERFVTSRDEAAFELLVWRHGPMVLSVCRRLLPCAQDAEDAFQAAFFVLARKATSITRREGVGGWLYRVAYRAALRARAGAARLARHEQPAVDLDTAEAPADVPRSDLRPVLDEEINRLPEKYRLAVVLCYLEGKTNQEAAQHLGCPEGTVASRLARGRERLRTRLTRRGVTLSVAALAAVLSRKAASAAPAPALVKTTAQAALAFAVSGVAPGAVPAPAALAEGVLRTMFLTKLRTVVTVLVVLGVLGAAVGGLAYRGLAGEPGKPAGGAAAAADAPCPDEPGDVVKVPTRLDGVLVLVGTEIKEGEKVPPGRVVTVKVGGEEKKYRRLRVGDKVEEGQLLARLDDRVARDELAIKGEQVKAAKAEWQATIKTRDEAEQRYRTMERLLKLDQKTVSMEDVRAAKLTWDRYFYEEVSKRAVVGMAEAEEKLAQTRLGLYEIRSPARGVITKIYKQAGEGARAYEPVFQVLTAAERDD
jgi:RNA polymerase sigma factor (sigma-70 family)